ncbi:unnamed protein product [Rhizophagus irregularis]|nr:unnamed protein product [Rhizophagus irregularis]
MLTIRYNGQTTTVPVIFTLPKPIKMKQSFEYDDEEEYESEELEEAQIYMSDFSGYSTEESLEFNPWENEVSPAHQNNEEKNWEHATPISQPPYRCNPKYREFLQGEINKNGKSRTYKKSASPWASPVVIVDKKGGEKRLCIDYRKLNAVTKADAYPLPRIDDMLESFSNATWFTTLDLASGYWQVAMDPADVEKTAFITPFGLYEFLVMPFGLAYAPGTFQRLMNRILQEYLGKFVATSNLKIKLKKCSFGLGNIHFLGHVVGREGIRPDPEKIEKIRTFQYQQPNSLRSALDASGTGLGAGAITNKSRMGKNMWSPMPADL